MHLTSHPISQPSQEPQSVDLVLREARKLHHAAQSASLDKSLPVLRRILNSHTLDGLSLPELHRRREMVQRKHILRTLAIEAGFASWEAYRPALASIPASQLTHIDQLWREAGYLNSWFSTFEEALAHAAAHGGRALRLGRQGVVVPAPDDADLSP